MHRQKGTMQRTITTRASSVPAPCRTRVDSSQHEVYRANNRKGMCSRVSAHSGLKAQFSHFISTTTVVVRVLHTLDLILSVFRENVGLYFETVDMFLAGR